MARKIIAVVVGYITMFVFVFISFTVLFLILGPDGAFQTGTYQVSTIWIVLSLALGTIASILGGFVCTLIAKDRKVALWLAGIVLVLGIVLAIPALSETEEESNRIREGVVDNTEAMQNAKQPPITLILNPIIGAIGVVVGSRLKKAGEKPQQNS